jgi:DNA-binding XRE family transcriptional regulator
MDSADPNSGGPIWRPALLAGMRSTHAQSSSHRAFGHAVRELRIYRGLSQEALGYAAGLHRNYGGAIERGELNPTIRTVLRLAVGLHVRPSRLVQLAERHQAEMTPPTDLVPGAPRHARV